MLTMKHYLARWLEAFFLVTCPWILYCAESVTDIANLSADVTEMIVSSSYLPLALNQTGKAVTVLSSEDITQSNASVLSNLIRNSPGVFVSRSGGYGANTQLRVRGAEGNHVLVMIDGVEVNDGSQGDEYNLAHLLSSGIEKVEIVRGPQSSLWGSDAVAGVVNILTRKTRRSKRASVFAEQGNQGLDNFGMGLGYRNDFFQGNLDASFMSLDGHNIARTGFEHDGYQNKSINLNGQWKIRERMEFDLTMRQAEGFNEYDNITFALPEDTDSTTEYRQSLFRIAHQYQIVPERWEQKIMLSKTKNTNENFDDKLLGSVVNATKNKAGLLNSLFWDDGSKTLNMLLELEEERFDQAGKVQPWGDPNQDRSRNNKSIAFEYIQSIGKGLHYAISGRHDNNDIFIDADTAQFSTNYHSNTLDANLRLALGTGVKNPTFTERFGFYTNFRGNPDLTPEKSKSWEAGFDKTFLDGTVNVSMTYFRAHLKNEINGFFFNTSSNMYTSQNIRGLSKRKGIELATTLYPGQSQTLDLAYTYIKSTEEDGAGGQVTELRRPEHIGSLTYNWQIRSVLGLHVNIQYTGKQVDLDFRSFPASRVNLNSYFILNVAVNYQSSNQTSWYLRAENILDEQYEEVLGYRAPGLGVKLGVRHNAFRL